MLDLIIKNGEIIDGTGAPSFFGDVAIKDGKIASVKKNITEKAEKIIDAKGLTVTPGFIDSHSHADNALLLYPDLTEKIEQGITTSICGQCGSTLAPVYKGITDENARAVGEYGKENEVYKTFGSMVNIVKNIPLGSNVMSFVGHGALRKAVIGMDNRKPSEDEMERMKALLRDAMENGAIGLSYGLLYTPGCYADTDELCELAKVVKEYEGMVSAHIRSEDFEFIKAVEEFLTVIKTADVKGVFSHHKSAYKENWGKVTHSIRMLEEANREGYDVYCDVYPYDAMHTSLSAIVIPKDMRATDSKGVVEMLSDSENRKKIKEIYSEKHGNDLSNLQISYCSGHHEYQGKRINVIADMMGKDHFEAVFELITITNNEVGACDFNMCEEDIEAVMKYERTMICTDSSVKRNLKVYHPRLRGTFPRVLGRYVRERKVMELSEMIRRCTSMPATVYGLSKKGLIKENFDADICIFDKDKIIDKAEFTDCHQRCEGLNYVILGGEIVAEDAVHNGKRMGKFIPR